MIYIRLQSLYIEVKFSAVLQRVAAHNSHPWNGPWHNFESPKELSKLVQSVSAYRPATPQVLCSSTCNSPAFEKPAPFSGFVTFWRVCEALFGDFMPDQSFHSAGSDKQKPHPRKTVLMASIHRIELSVLLSIIAAEKNWIWIILPIRQKYLNWEVWRWW